MKQGKKSIKALMILRVIGLTLKNLKRKSKIRSLKITRSGERFCLNLISDSGYVIARERAPLHKGKYEREAKLRLPFINTRLVYAIIYHPGFNLSSRLQSLE